MADTSVSTAEDTSEGGRGSTLVAIALVALLSVGGGLGLAWYSGQIAEKTSAAVPPEGSEQTVEGTDQSAPATKIAELPSIMTNLSGEGAPWLRLDLSVVLPQEMPDQNTKLAELSQDFLSFVRTLRADQIAGGSNLQFLKQDLQEIARIRTSDHTVDVLIRTLIVE